MNERATDARLRREFQAAARAELAGWEFTPDMRKAVFARLADEAAADLVAGSKVPHLAGRSRRGPWRPLYTVAAAAAAVAMFFVFTQGGVMRLGGPGAELDMEAAGVPEPIALPGAVQVEVSLGDSSTNGMAGGGAALMMAAADAPVAAADATELRAVDTGEVTALSAPAGEPGLAPLARGTMQRSQPTTPASGGTVGAATFRGPKDAGPEQGVPPRFNGLPTRQAGNGTPVGRIVDGAGGAGSSAGSEASAGSAGDAGVQALVVAESDTRPVLVLRAAARGDGASFRAGETVRLTVLVPAAAEGDTEWIGSAAVRAWVTLADGSRVDLAPGVQAVTDLADPEADRELTFTWDQRTAGGALVPAGEYTVYARATATSGVMAEGHLPLRLTR